MNEWEHFKLEFDPTPTPKYPYGYWVAYATIGFDGEGPTPDIALANLIIALVKAYQKDR